MFKRSTLRTYLACVCVILSLSTMSALADSSYQFSVGLNASALDYDGGEYGNAHGETLGMNATAYLEPINLSNAMPYDLTPFYTRTSGLFLSSSKSRATELNQIVSGRVLKKSDSHVSSIGMRLANADFPIWLGLDYTRVGSSHFYFSDGSSGTNYHRYIKSATLGWFINEAFGVYGFYQDDENDRDSYGMGAHYLHDLGSLGHVEAGLQYTKIETEAIRLELNGTVRNANVYTRKESVRAVSVRYFPTVKAEIGLRYRKMDYEYDSYGYSVAANASYYVLSNLQLGVHYREVHQDDLAIRSSQMEYSSLGASASLKF